ncbi:MAG: hypothetical protein HKN87_15175 [Saprospiraceae bacterium]|nr:hypothetical protein [Saprospiraceae bacterium]
MSLIFTRTFVKCLATGYLALFYLTMAFAESAPGGSAWTCPEEHVYINCGELHDDLSYYGAPKATYGYGHEVHIEGPYEHKYLDKCGLGKITRKWKIKYHYEWYWCEQTIHIKAGYGGTFDGHHDVWWPKDYHMKTCEKSLHPDYLPGGYNWPEFKHKGCSKLGLRYEDKVHPYSNHSQGGYGYDHHGNPCKVIFRTWELIDWCQYDSHYGKTHYGKIPGRWEYIQKIYIYDDHAPEIKVCPENIEVSSGDCEGKKTYVEIPPVEATDNCGDVYYAYTRKHLGYDPYHNGYGSSSSGINYSGNNASGYYEPGQTIVTYKAYDVCGNTTTCEFVVTVTAEDTKPPRVLAITSLTVSLVQSDSNDGKIEVWPSEFNTSSSDNCTPAEDLKYELEQSVFTCEDYGTNQVKFTVTDEAGNSDYAIVQVIVQANSFDCIGGTVAGNIVADDGSGVDNVEVTIMDEMHDMTDLEGAFTFENLPLGRELTIQPYKNSDAREGVDMYDYALLMLHVEGIREITDPHKLMAADVDNNHVIDSEDLLALQRVIIGIDRSFPNNTSWKFVSMAYDFPDSLSVLDVDMPEQHPFSLLEKSEMHMDFRGVKVGDLGSIVEPTVGGDVENEVSLVISDQIAEANEVLTVPFSFDKATRTNALSFTLNLDHTQLDLVNIREGSLAKAGTLTFIPVDKQGDFIAATWYASEEVAFNADENLFELVVRAKRDMYLNHAVQISSAFAPAVSGGESVGTQVLILTTKDLDMNQQGLALFQNRPNPFKAETSIGFHMPEAGNADLRIMDSHGKMVLQREAYFGKGYQEMRIEKADLSTDGLLFYQLTHNGITKTKKMLILD